MREEREKSKNLSPPAGLPFSLRRVTSSMCLPSTPTLAYLFPTLDIAVMKDVHKDLCFPADATTQRLGWEDSRGLHYTYIGPLFPPDAHS